LDHGGCKGWPPLFSACKYGNTAVVEELLCKGARIDLCDDKGNTALHHTHWGKPEIAKLLLDAGIDRNKKNDKGETPLDKI